MLYTILSVVSNVLLALLLAPYIVFGVNVVGSWLRLCRPPTLTIKLGQVGDEDDEDCDLDDFEDYKPEG